MKQLRGCSHFYTADFDMKDGKMEFGTPEKVAPVKGITREINAEGEEVWADNELQDTTYQGTKVARTFNVTRIADAMEAKMLGHKTITVGNKIAIVTPPTGASRPHRAYGYALHDGDPSRPCLLVWAFNGKVTSISQAANTIDGGTGSTGQDVAIDFHAAKQVWDATKESDLDVTLPVTAEDDAQALMAKWFAQVVTPDNIVELFGTTTTQTTGA